MNVVDTSTEDEDLKPKGSWTSPRSRTLQQMEKELDKTGSDDSDDLISFSNIQKENSRSALNIYSDSDTDSSLKGGRSSSKNVRTKAAVKEFTGGKNKKSQPPPSSKTPSKNKHVNSFIEDDFYRDKENLNTTKRKPKESPNDLIVPQRQAAKKATESIRSAQVKKNDQVLAEQEAVKTMSPNDENRIKSKSSKVRGGKDVEHKRSGNKEDRSKSSNDVYEFDKDMDQDILAYVPQRQAAKIAAEHIKSGLHKLPSGGIDGLEQGESKCSKVPESPAKKREEVKVKKEPTPVEEKTKKLVKPVEVKGRKTPKFSVSSSSSSSSSSTSSGSTSTTTSTSSESEDDEKKPSAVDKKSLFDSPVKEEKKQTRASVALQEKKPISRKLESSSSGSSILDKSKLSIQSSSSSSSDSDDSKPSRSSLTKETQASTPTPPPQQAVAKRSRKSPEKKLKTSDGRPELDLQQPPSKREESSPSTKRGRGKSGETVPAAPTVHSKSEPQVKESNSSCVKRHSKAPSVSPKKEPQPSQGRKRKPDDLEKKSSPAQRSSSPHVARAVEVKRSPCAPVVAAAAPISTPTQHSPAPSRKVDSKKISDSPGKQRTPESQSIASMLEREMAERKAGRDVGNRKSNSSKKSLNRLFEKRDELVMKEKERKDKEVKPSEKSVQKSPDKCNKEKPVAAPVKDENRNDKIEPKWLSFNNADRLREEEKKPQSKRSLFSPVPDSEPQPELLESAANNNQKSSADMNVKNEPGSLPVLSPPPLLQPLSGPLDKCDLSQMDTLLDSKVSRTPSLSVLSGLSSRVLSPQPSKDSSIELFDLENDILDHSHNDSFTDLRNCGQLFPFPRSLMGMPPSKEDSDRETMNLVEKLREQYAKKTHEPASQEPDDDEPLEARPPFQPSPTPSQVPDIPTSNPCTLPVDAKLESILNQEEPQLIAPSIPDEIKLAAVENKAILNAVEETALRMGVTEQQADKQSEYEPSPSVDHFQYPPYSLSLDVGKVPGREKLDRSNSAQADERWVPPSIGIAAPPSVYESVSSPYRNKWAESEIMPSRHSSSSSASSTSSSSQREDIEMAGSQGKHEDLPIQPPVPTPLELLSFHHPAGPMQFNPGCPLTNPLPGPPSFHFGDPSVQFPVHPPTMSLFQAPPFSSANPPPLFPPSFPPSFATPQLKVPQDDLPPVSAPPTPGSMQMPQPPPLSLSQPLQPPPAACSAAFTASSHNMAITAAMVSPMVPPSNTQEPSLVPLPFPPDNCQQMPKSEPSVQPQPTPIQPKVEPPTVQPAQQPQEATRPPTPTPPQVQQQPPTPTPPPKTTPQPSVTIQQPPSVPPSSVSSTEGPPTPKPSPASLPQGKKSPSKPTRASARFIAQQKSPAKSPGKSPRQLADLKKVKDGGSGTKRGRPSGSRGTSRGRGRGRGRGGRVGGALGDTASKLAGTVYDFDFDDEEDGGGDSLEHLRAMRERRKSSDVHEKLSGNTPKDSPQSPKFTSPAQHRSNKSTPSAVFPSPVDNNRGRSSDVQPMLPGPVDMRTYSSFNTSVNTASFHNHLMEPLPQDRLDTDKDYVAELEEEIKTLKSSTVPKVQETPPPATLAPPLPAPSAPSSAPAPEEPKSPHHTDSRNQLKVKIKGPFLDANYMASSVVPQASVVPVSSNHPPEPPVTPVVNSTSGTTSNLRRMRKKELLRQYWNQDMNMDETTVPIVPPPALPVPDPVPSSRNVITIPKAVASMPNIPTREDYKAVVDANMEKKRRKEKSAYDLDLGDHWRPSASAAAAEPPTQAPPPVKRGRGRAAKTKPVTPPPSSTPKLKIKLGDTASVTTMSEDKKNLRVRPPKKRITAPAPTVEEMKRESMKFRNMVMADFDEEEKVVEVVSKKRKKKNAQPTDKTTGKGEPTPSVRVITDDAKPKLIIRFGKPAAPAEPTIEQSHSPTDGDRTSECSALRKVRTSKTVPIRLKLSRCEEGYVMKPSSDSVNASEERNGNGSVPSSSKAPAPSGKSAETLPPAPPPKPNPTDAQPPPEPPPPTLPLSKDCEVR